MRTTTFAAAMFLSSLGFHSSVAAQTAQAGAAQTPAAQPAADQPVIRKDDAGKTLYTVVEGYKVDDNTMNGFRAWRAAACDRCHGANQQGLVGPSLIESLKTLSKDDFVKTLHDGRLEKGMPSWQNSKMVMENIDGLYAYLKGRSNGDIKRAHVEELKP